MTVPTLLLALLFTLLYGSLYHLIRGGGVWRLFFYMGLSGFGFAAGHLVGLWRGWFFLEAGALNLGVSSIGSILFLIAGDWLSRIEVQPESTV